MIFAPADAIIKWLCELERGGSHESVPWIYAMKLSEVKANRAQFIGRVRAARLDANPTVHVNCGIKKPDDVSAIIRNRITEKPDWNPMYDYAAGFE